MTAQKTQDKTHYGATALSEVLQDVEYPIGMSELLTRFGECQILWTPDERTSIAELLENVEQDEFYSTSDVVAAISRPGH